MNHQDIFEKIAPFFTLLYIYDIEDYQVQHLNLLLKELQDRQSHSAITQPIFEQLEAKSKKNAAQRLKKKKQMRHQANSFEPIKQVKPNPPSAFRKEEKVSYNQFQFDSSRYEINESVIHEFPIKHDFQQLEKRSGKIYDGQLIISLELSDLLRGKKTSAQFYVNSRARDSTITKETLALIGLSSKDPSLLVDSRKQKFLTGATNILGLTFLQKYKVLLQCNYRSQQCCFELIYTQ